MRFPRSTFPWLTRCGRSALARVPTAGRGASLPTVHEPERDNPSPLRVCFPGGSPKRILTAISPPIQDARPIVASGERSLVATAPGSFDGKTGDPIKCAVIVKISQDGKFEFYKSVCP